MTIEDRRKQLEASRPAWEEHKAGVARLRELQRQRMIDHPESVTTVTMPDGTTYAFVS